MKLPRMLVLFALLCAPLAAQDASKGKGGQAKLPPEFQYDTPPKAKQVVKPIYPYALLQGGVKGSAKVVYVVNLDGTVTEVKIIQATRPEFGEALAAAVQRLTFTPALKGGKPSLAILRHEQDFEPRNRRGLITVTDLDLLERETKKPESILSAGRLDTPLSLLKRQDPAFPLGMQAKAGDGEALLEIIVAEDGTTHLPRIVSASDPAFGYAAVQAVAAWTFAPPKVSGKAVTCRVRVPFKFSHHKNAAAPASSGPPSTPAS